ncbi:hypothetical protein MBGDC06_00515 [Thermoplasmatales archaeon SCGC AB-539-C06]|nr:hypothetical protein MBGDC06_00515 [Thermoplasmatales archaeon SCGC AB-539-C06]
MVEEIDAEVGDTVRFRIIIYYYGDYTLYNIHVVDELPECLEYADNAIPKEPVINGQILTWDLGTALYDGQHALIEFDALVVGDDCEDCINLAKVWADECSGDDLYWEDSATIHVVCGLTADTGGPYYADIGETITIAGSAAGGVPPYAFEWDLDDDDIYGVDDDPDEPTIATFTYSWDAPGIYVIKLKVTDKNNNWYIDDTTVTVSGNNPPNKPSSRLAQHLAKQAIHTHIPHPPLILTETKSIICGVGATAPIANGLDHMLLETYAVLHMSGQHKTATR